MSFRKRTDVSVAEARRLPQPAAGRPAQAECIASVSGPRLRGDLVSHKNQSFCSNEYLRSTKRDRATLTE